MGSSLHSEIVPDCVLLFLLNKIDYISFLFYKYFTFLAGFIVKFSCVPDAAALASIISSSRLINEYITTEKTGIAAIIRGVVKELKVHVLCVSSLKLFHSSQCLFLWTPYAPDLLTLRGLKKKIRQDRRLVFVWMLVNKKNDILDFRITASSWWG